ncbi:winged helix-turn-helix domain-containing protein [Nocardioides jiangxiensis]|uniref:Crosslink repair DNA glycosylase YcaQ family protein n=1 Tax=Nocardioides jiangxiensis TaxID=3064524 RepID=A0ABT9B1H3_9ACTN|nr:crosslink repair DNA glycosylase YcaQ family protein [Nocardioides sp. WY-20]MDO7867467.1 crosslink repair DNA glycosylase YcaQ family protein [Nocardioides sp. WY-20]
MESLSRAQARRVALAAQGFLDTPHAQPTLRTLDRAVGRTGVLQIDSVNVLQRAQFMPLYARMGPYDTDLLRRAAEERPRRLVEYWAHEAAYMPVDLWPFMQHRMARAHERAWGGPRSIARERPDLVRDVLADVRERGARTARQIDADLTGGAARTKDHWGWNWSEVKKALEFLFYAGDLTVAGRNGSFERLYDVPDRVLPRVVLETPTPTAAEQHRELVRRAAVSHGVGTEQCLRDYYRMGVAEARAAIAELVEAGELLPVTVEGWGRPAYLHREARLPRRVAARTLLSPFDPVVWERARAEALFDFRYRIEIYVPEARRVHGYYVLPFLLGDRPVARVDLKADRATGTLLVPGAFAEPAAPDATAAELATELRRLAGWLGLERIVVGERGDLAPALAAVLASGVH